MSPDDLLLSARVFRLSISHRGTERILKTATMTAVDMVSNVGGVLGLFSGFSVLSGLEVAYWAVICMCRRRRKKNGKSKKAGQLFSANLITLFFQHHPRGTCPRSSRCKTRRDSLAHHRTCKKNSVYEFTLRWSLTFQSIGKT